MAVSKEKIKEIYEVLPKLNCGFCGFGSCSQFARAVANGEAPCYGCVSGGPEVAAIVCEIMGTKILEEAIYQFDSSPRFYQPGLSGGKGMGRGIGWGLDGGQGMSRGMGRGMGRGSGRGRRGR